jgi:glycosyltransferase involved in cell wall biosynthesis
MNDELPLVCICIPTYNAAATIRETLESILAQTYSNLVVHVSDNASTDDTLKVIESIEDPRITIHRNTENVGGEGNFNRCIQLAEGKYTAIFHADDLYEREIVAKQVARLEADQTLGAVFTAATTIDEQGKPFAIIGRPVGVKQDACIYQFTELIKAVLEKSNFLVCPSVMVRTYIYQEEVVHWRGDLFRSSADLDVWLRIASKHPIAILNEPLMRYRIDSKQYSNAVRQRTERPDIFLVLEYYLAQPDVQAALTSADWRHYRELEINDQVWRAINLFTTGRMHDAKLMLRGVYNRDTLHAAVTSRRGLLTLLAAASLSLLTALGAKKLGQVIIRRLRKISNK